MHQILNDIKENFDFKRLSPERLRGNNILTLALTTWSNGLITHKSYDCPETVHVPLIYLNNRRQVQFDINGTSVNQDFKYASKRLNRNVYSMAGNITDIVLNDYDKIIYENLITYLKSKYQNPEEIITTFLKNNYSNNEKQFIDINGKIYKKRSDPWPNGLNQTQLFEYLYIPPELDNIALIPKYTIWELYERLKIYKQNNPECKWDSTHTSKIINNGIIEHSAIPLLPNETQIENWFKDGFDEDNTYRHLINNARDGWLFTNKSLSNMTSEMLLSLYYWNSKYTEIDITKHLNKSLINDMYNVYAGDEYNLLNYLVGLDLGYFLISKEINNDIKDKIIEHINKNNLLKNVMINWLENMTKDQLIPFLNSLTKTNIDININVDNELEYAINNIIYPDKLCLSGSGLYTLKTISDEIQKIAQPTISIDFN